jgi:L-ascorbate metabolism protein UlaG (beta-lactamase superfamily)
MRLFAARLTACMALLLATTAAFAQAGKTELLWLGQAAFRLTTPSGKVIMIDPWIRTNPTTPAEYKDLEKLGKVDLILVTHGHFDHIADAPALAMLHKAQGVLARRPERRP